MDPMKESLIEQFINVAGVDKDRAKFFLESSSWDLSLAIASFYEDDHEMDVGMYSAAASMSEPSSPPSTGSKLAEAAFKPQQEKPKFASITDIRQSDNTDSDEEGQAFYTGGSERSGQQVLGPPKKKSGSQFVDDIFRQVKEHGAEVVDPDQPQEKRSAAFRGTGYRLGDMEGASDVIKGENLSDEPQPTRVLKMWKNGFSIDDGPLREYTDEKNKKFLDSITRGEIPQELVQEAEGGKINLNMERHQDMDYVLPKRKMTAFMGQGHMLGSPSPAMSSFPSSSTAAAAAGSSTDPVVKADLKVDSSKPTTNIQIRLVDGARLKLTLNHSHRISDIRNYIVSERPEYACEPFFLSTYTSKELEDENQTLVESNLLNAVVMQRRK